MGGGGGEQEGRPKLGRGTADQERVLPSVTIIPSSSARFPSEPLPFGRDPGMADDSSLHLYRTGSSERMLPLGRFFFLARLAEAGREQGGNHFVWIAWRGGAVYVHTRTSKKMGNGKRPKVAS